jgi:cytochrome c553
MNITILIRAMVGVSLVWMVASSVSAAGNLDAGKQKFYTCEGCHAVAGYTNTYPTYHVPRLGGQHADYVIAALKAYGEHERKHASMKGNVDNLSEQDMEDIAAYVSKFRGMNSTLPVTGNPQAGKEKAAMCASCHGEDGNSDNSMFPRLAGQYESYLIRSLQEYKSGARSNAMMAGFASMLTETDINNLAAYYASQKKGLTLPVD